MSVLRQDRIVKGGGAERARGFLRGLRDESAMEDDRAERSSSLCGSKPSECADMLDHVGGLLEIPFADEVIPHGVRHEEMRIRGSSKVGLKPRA